MTKFDKETTCNWMRERIEAYLDKELPADEVSKFKSHLGKCPDCSRELNLSGQIQSALRNLPARDCPDRVTDVVCARIRDELRAERKKRLRAWRFKILRPVPVMALLIAALIVVTFVSRPRKDVDFVVPDEIVLAELQARWTFAYIDKISRKTGFIVRDDVIKSRVVEPAKHALKAAQGM